MFYIPTTGAGAIRLNIRVPYRWMRQPEMIASPIDWTDREQVSIPDVKQLTFDYIGKIPMVTVEVINIYCELRDYEGEKTVELGTKDFPFRSLPTAMNHVYCLIRSSCCGIFKLNINGTVRGKWHTVINNMDMDYRLVICAGEEFNIDPSDLGWNLDARYVHFLGLKINPVEDWKLPTALFRSEKSTYTDCELIYSSGGEFSVLWITNALACVNCKAIIRAKQIVSYGNTTILPLYQCTFVDKCSIFVETDNLSITPISASVITDSDIDIVYINSSVNINTKGMRATTYIRDCIVRITYAGNGSCSLTGMICSASVENVECRISITSAAGYYVAGLDAVNAKNADIYVNTNTKGTESVGIRGAVLIKHSINIRVYIEADSWIHITKSTQSEGFAAGIVIYDTAAGCSVNTKLTITVSRDKLGIIDALSKVIGIQIQNSDIVFSDLENCVCNVEAIAIAVPESGDQYWQEQESACGMFGKEELGGKWVCFPCKGTIRTPGYSEDLC